VWLGPVARAGIVLDCFKMCMFPQTVRTALSTPLYQIGGQRSIQLALKLQFQVAWLLGARGSKLAAKRRNLTDYLKTCPQLTDL